MSTFCKDSNTTAHFVPKKWQSPMFLDEVLKEVYSKEKNTKAQQIVSAKTGGSERRNADESNVKAEKQSKR